ncbi:lactonase family protein [Caulobacter sp. S45]|uniref:lactonase family protein n=1 Tax=Caulobacter sp. S45 TaxID=1641861 RepID=UPI00131B39A1|nr:lactonase family protein [Caulobacter sp. S45]
MTKGLDRRVLLTSGLALGAVAVHPVRAERKSIIAYVGSYTPNGHGVFKYSFDNRLGVLAPLGLAAPLANPSWITLDPQRNLLFALSEIEHGLVTAFAISPQNGSLSRINAVSAGASGPVYAALHPSGRFLLIANYTGGGVAVLSIDSDGALGGPVEVIAAARPAPPPPPAAQEAANLALSDHSAPHMHMIAADPTGRFAIAADAGSDRIYVWRIDTESGRLTPAATPFISTLPGSAPRHFVFHPNGRRLYDLQEHDGVVCGYAFDPSNGALTLEQMMPTAPDGFAGSNLASELTLSLDGRFLFAGNRLRNSVRTIALGRSGRMRLESETWIQGDYPRSFTLDPSGRFLICCNQRSDNLTVFGVDPKTGALGFTGHFNAIGSPAVAAFHRVAG